MRIILANNTLSWFAGSETWTYTLAVELKQQGYDVTCYSNNIGEIANKLKGHGIPCVKSLNSNMKFDVGICNHFNTTTYVKKTLPALPIINTVHGIIGGPETSVQGCQAYVAVSEEVQALMKTRDGVDATIIRNAVNLERFSEKHKKNKQIKKILISSSYHCNKSQIYKVAADGAKRIGAQLIGMGRAYDWIWNTESKYNEADIVLTLGRGCIEAMACNRPVICWGHWGGSAHPLSTDGFIDKKTYKESRKNNFSSRRFRHRWGVNELLKEFEKYDSEYDYTCIIKPEHDIKYMTNEYLKIANNIIK